MACRDAWGVVIGWGVVGGFGGGECRGVREDVVMAGAGSYG